MMNPWSPMIRSSNPPDEVYARVTLSGVPPNGDSLTSVTFAAPFQQVEFATVAGAMETPTEETMDPAPITTNGWGFLSFETRGDGARVGVCEFMGLVKCWLGPFVQ